MKNKIAIALLGLSISSGNVFAQPFSTSGSTALAFPGISSIMFQPSASANYGIKGQTNNYLDIYANTGFNNGAAILMNGSGSTLKPGAISLYSSGTPSATTAIDISNYNPSGGSFSPLLQIYKNGNLGIADYTPVEKLTINGNMAFSTVYGQARKIFGKAHDWGLEIYGNNSGSDGASIDINSWGKTVAGGVYRGSIMMTSVGPANSAAYALELRNYDPWASPAVTNSLVKVLKNGQMIIGNDVTSFPSTYKLIVQDGILTEKIKVALSTDAVNWSDFVFADDYQLRPLNEVESFVKKNKHLPEIPSAKEVYANGLDLAQMDAKLLQKIEELTLYVIEQQKEINSLKSKLKK